MYFLCGFWCAGKSTAGNLCARKLGWPFYDTDRLIERVCGLKSVRQAWQELGETRFRALESELLFSLKREKAIVALGGGTLLLKENRQVLRTLGSCIYLKASVAALYRRSLERGFPASSGPLSLEQFEQIALKRFSLYEEESSMSVESSHLSVGELAEKLWQAIISDSSYA